jgi:hypothetical protein
LCSYLVLLPFSPLYVCLFFDLRLQITLLIIGEIYIQWWGDKNVWTDDLFLNNLICQNVLNNTSILCHNRFAAYQILSSASILKNQTVIGCSYLVLLPFSPLYVCLFFDLRLQITLLISSSFSSRYTWKNIHSFAMKSPKLTIKTTLHETNIYIRRFNIKNRKNIVHYNFLLIKILNIGTMRNIYSVMRRQKCLDRWFISK